MVSVYILKNQQGNVEYVGESKNPEFRFRRHVYYKPHKGSNVGKFYERYDLTMEIHSTHETKKEAYKVQCMLQDLYGLRPDQNQAMEAGLNTRFKKGHKPSEETREKMKLAKLGKTYKEIGRA